jgi:putative endopeptidase
MPVFVDALPDCIRVAMPRQCIRLTVPLFAVLALRPAQSALAQVAQHVARTSMLESTVDASIKPGDDFFAYANGAWLKATTIPVGRERWGARDEINEITRPRVAKLIDDAVAAPRGSTARKVADFRASLLNDAAVEAKGLAAIKPLLDSIGQIRDRATLTRFLGRMMPADVDPLYNGVYRSSHVLGFAVQLSVHGEKTYDVFLVQGGLGLGDRDQYVGTEPPLQALRMKYSAYVDRILALAGLSRATERAAHVLALETAIAQSQATSAVSANDRNADIRWTRADFAQQAPGMDWPAFFDAAGLGRQHMFGVWQPVAVTGLAALVAQQPLDTWKDYLRFQAIDRYAYMLPRAFADERAALHANAAVAPIAPPSPAKRALDITQSKLSDAIGRMYAAQYFPAAQKARVQRIVANVADAFARRVAAVTWMSRDSKAIALAKVRSLYVGIGYPDRWPDYADLTIDAADAVGNLRRIDARNRRRALARVGQPVDFTEWWIAPQSVGALLVFQQNTYQFSAGLLQAPKYDPDASDAATYGAIGAIIAHDMSHFVDLLGAEYDSTFAIRHWWTADDLVGFKARAQLLDQQFSGYHPYPDVAVNGTLTEPENVADLAGLDAAFDAYRYSLGPKLSDSAFVRQYDREFFLAFAQSWRTKISEPALRTQLATNDHAPEMFRISTVRNLDAWYAAFDVVPGQRLYVAPADRVHIW